MPMEPKMYVLVRKDLSQVYGPVQGAHALAQYALEHSEGFKQWGNHNLIFLGVRNLIDLRAWEVRLRASSKVFSTFREPDLDNQETAISCYDTGEVFKDLRMV